MRSGDARVLGELIDIAVWGAEVDPGIAAVIDPGLIEDLDAGGPQLGGCGVDVVDQEPGDRAGGEVPVDVGVGSEDLDLAAVRQLQLTATGLLELERKAQDLAEEGNRRLWVVGPGAHPGQLDDPHTWTVPQVGLASAALVVAWLSATMRTSLTRPPAQTAYCSGAATNRWWHPSEQK